MKESIWPEYIYMKPHEYASLVDKINASMEAHGYSRIIKIFEPEKTSEVVWTVPILFGREEKGEKL